MATSLFTFVSLFDRALSTAEHLLTKGAEHAATTGVTADQMLDWRLIEDMNPLRFQLMVMVNFARSWPAKVVGVEAPTDIERTLEFAGFKAALADAKTWLAGLTAEQFAGIDEKPLQSKIGATMEMTLPREAWITGFATTNIYFHLSMVYAILRLHGVNVGKMDLFPQGL